MTSFRLFTSNRLEILAGALADVLRTPLSSPFDPEIIVVQSQGMERWLSMALAGRHGICANYAFPFPNAFVLQVFQKVIPELPQQSPFDPGTMTWKIMSRLPVLKMTRGFESLRIYLDDDGGGLKRFQLSLRLADLFDQYLLFRPEMIFQWEEGLDDDWQAIIWRDIVKGNEKAHRAALAKKFFETVKNPSIPTEGLPERVSIFGISAIPRFYMQVLAAISNVTQVNLFLMNPCREYWGDILSDWEMRRTRAGGRSKKPMGNELHLEKGNSLLASMGTLGRDFFDMVNEFECEEISSFDEPGEETLLACLQSDILKLRERHRESGGRKVVSKDDMSVRIHSCHGPMREIEVLHDQLLHMFENDPSLMPRDILVMMPDVETYAPYIQAVFDMPSEDAMRVPFSIADRSFINESEIIQSFLAILELQGGRFGASQVLGILESEAVRRKFGLSEADLDLTRGWVKGTRIRWGIDEESRRRLGLPPFKENSWQAGLERLLLGYAMPGQDEVVFEDVLPYDEIEGGEAQVLGNFLEFTKRLFGRVNALGKRWHLETWAKLLSELLDEFFMPDEETEREAQVIRRILSELSDMSQPAGPGFQEDVDLRVIKSYVTHYLQREGFGFGFITGGVTFCAMLPMRSIPFKVICLVGMNSDAYPGDSRPLGFDLMARHPKPGDRSRRNDDRYLFLEAILSARENLYVSYVGQNARDNSPTPPSVLVSELMDYIEQGFETTTQNILESVVTEHRLQAFSPEYFRGREKSFSYSAANYRAAQCLLLPREKPKPFISEPLSIPEEIWKTVDLEDLCRFFANPARFLLMRRLGIYLDEAPAVLEEREAFDVKGLERFLLEKQLLEWRMAGKDLHGLSSVTHASGQLPPGTVGKCLYDGISQGVEYFVEKTEPFVAGKTLDPIDVRLDISGFRLTGRIENLCPERYIQTRYARIKPRDRLRVWIHHLALNLTGGNQYPRISMIVGLELNRQKAPSWASWEYTRVENGEGILVDLLEKYWAGLIKPLHFFPDASWDFALEALEKKRPDEDALRKARFTWTGSDYRRGEREDAYYQLCFGAGDPLDSEFQGIAKDIFGPLLRHQIAVDD